MIGIPKLPTGQNILQVPLVHRTGTCSANIGEFLVDIARETFHQGPNFDFEETLGRADWKGDIAHALILEGFLDGELDLNGNVVDYNEGQFSLLLDFALNNLSDYVYDLEDKTREEEEERKDVFKKYMAVQLMHSNGVISVVGFRSTMMSKAEAENWLKEEAPQSPNREWVIVGDSGLTT